MDKGYIISRIDPKIAGQLPAMAIAQEVNHTLATAQSVVVTAPPGAGKSTLLPLTILDAMPEGKILMLEPRRLAARQIAERMASMLGEPVGRTVGYRVRFETKVSADTRIEVLTEGILTRMLVEDQTLDGVSAVIFDEFHERSIHSDVALALTRQTQEIIRPELKIVIMSATIDADEICSKMGAPLIESEGKMYPVEVLNLPSNEDAPEAVAHAVRLAHKEHEGDILAFLPGEAEIRRCEEIIGQSLGDTKVYPLYGMLTSAEQKEAISPSAPGQRKVVLATPIAETSITIEGVRIVVDSGLCKKMVFDPQNSLSRLETARISMDMARQRTGRAGRTAPGVCYRLWSAATERTMADSRVPEILEADLAPMLLDIAASGSGELTWLTPPPAAHVSTAQSLLTLLGAIDAKGAITSHGRRLAKMPCHPRIAQMLLRSEKALASDIAAMLEERDPLPGEGAAISIRLEELRKHPNSRNWSRIHKIAEQYRSLVKVAEDDSYIDAYAVGSLIAAAYPERIGKAVGNGRFMLATGDMAYVERTDEMAAYDWIAVASLNTRAGADGRIFLAAPLDPKDVETTTYDNVSWDSRKGAVVSQRETRIGRLVVDTRQISSDPAVTARFICEAVQKEGLSMLDFDDEVENLQRRIAAVAAWHPELELPDSSTDALLRSAPEWLPFYIGKATTKAELKKIDLCSAIWARLSYEQQQAVDRLAPTHIPVPTGSRIRVEYRLGADAPVLRVRLQECFGLLDTPRVDGGTRPVIMELLSPGFKPVQLTMDLKSFWEGTYFEVKKELKRRYPKHSWPDNPLEEEAVRGVKKTAR